MFTSVLLWGSVVGLIHFVAIGVLYSNPFIDRFYARAQKEEPGVRAWPSKPRYIVTQLLGTQVEVFILAFGYLWLRQHVPLEGWTEALALGGLFSGIRVYPRFWNMWIQSTYPNNLLAIELVNGIISTFIIVCGMELFA